VGLVVAASTDSRNRTIREMKGLVKDFPGAKTSFLRQFCTKNASFYQDRPGTNIGTVLIKGDVFLQAHQWRCEFEGRPLRLHHLMLTTDNLPRQAPDEHRKS
jgi:hypothetical protein